MSGTSRLFEGLLWFSMLEFGCLIQAGLRLAVLVLFEADWMFFGFLQVLQVDNLQLFFCHRQV